MINKKSKKKQLDYFSSKIEQGINDGLNNNLDLKSIIKNYIINIYGSFRKI